MLCHPSKLVLFKASSYNLPDMFQLKDPIKYQNKYREGEDFVVSINSLEVFHHGLLHVYSKEGHEKAPTIILP